MAWLASFMIVRMVYHEVLAFRDRLGLDDDSRYPKSETRRISSVDSLVAIAYT